MNLQSSMLIILQISLAQSSISYSAEPPPDKRIIVGEDAYRKRGPFLTEIKFPLIEDRKAYPAAYIDNPGKRLVGFFYREDTSNPRILVLNGKSDTLMSSPVGSSVCLPRIQNAILPIFNHLYRVEDAEIPVKIKLIELSNDEVPTPLGDSRILHYYSLNLTIQTVNIPGKDNKFTGYTYKILNFNETEQSCSLKLTPLEDGRAFLKEFEVTVRKNSILDLHDKKYKVLNVVPPREIPNVGNVIGWVEIKSTPEPTEK